MLVGRGVDFGSTASSRPPVFRIAIQAERLVNERSLNPLAQDDELSTIGPQAHIGATQSVTAIQDRMSG